MKTPSFGGDCVGWDFESRGVVDICCLPYVQTQGYGWMVGGRGMIVRLEDTRCNEWGTKGRWTSAAVCWGVFVHRNASTFKLQCRWMMEDFCFGRRHYYRDYMRPRKTTAASKAQRRQANPQATCTVRYRITTSLFPRIHSKTRRVTRGYIFLPTFES